MVQTKRNSGKGSVINMNPIRGQRDPEDGVSMYLRNVVNTT
jgi:hypothetical protein